MDGSSRAGGRCVCLRLIRQEDESFSSCTTSSIARSISTMQLLVLVVLAVACVHPVACSRAHADGHAEQQTASLHIPKHTIREEYTFYILKAALTGYILATPSVAVALEVGKEDTELTQYPMDADKRRKGEDWPLYGVTMTGLLRLDVLEMALKYVVQHHVPGDFLEAGVWRGGSSIFARAAWNLLGQYHRSVHVADSFAGLPRGSVEQDQRVAFHKMGYLAVSLEDVKANFERFGLNPDAGVHFYKGFFNESLPAFREVCWWRACVYEGKVPSRAFRSVV